MTLIALTSFAREQMVRDGYSPDQILIKPNSASDAGVGAEMRDRRVLFVGRLSEEKGADFLIQVAKSVDATFEIIGDGPQEERLRATASRNVVFRGRLERHIVLERIKGATVVAVPSRCFESFPMIIPEAFSTGTPVIASGIGALPEIVEDGISGLIRRAGDQQSWVESVQLLIDEPHLAKSLGAGARLAFENKYTSEHNLSRLTEIYSFAINRAAKFA